MSARLSSPDTVVTAFLAALERFDLDAAAELLDPDVLYVNVSLPPARGRAATLRVLGALVRYGSGFSVETHRMAVAGTTVLTERTDTIGVGRVHGSFWVCGTFEVLDGRITLWRDHFDWYDVTRGFAAGAVRAVSSLVRRPAGAARQDSAR